MPTTTPFRFHLSVSLVLAAAGSVVLWYLLGSKFGWLPVLLSWFIAVNLVTFLYYGFDKHRASAAGRRVPETVLHLLATLGGSAGAWAGMNLFRHKTIKGTFRLLFFVIVWFQLLAIAWILKMLYWP